VTGSPAPAPGGEVAERFTLAAGAAEWLARAVTEYEILGTLAAYCERITRSEP
jgi:hypothetical protein